VCINHLSLWPFIQANSALLCRWLCAVSTSESREVKRHPQSLTILAVLVTCSFHEPEQLGCVENCRRSFFIAAPVVWNSLPFHLRSPSISRSQFWAGLKTYLFRLAFRWLFLWELLKRLDWTEPMYYRAISVVMLRKLVSGWWPRKADRHRCMCHYCWRMNLLLPFTQVNYHLLTTLIGPCSRSGSQAKHLYNCEAVWRV